MWTINNIKTRTIECESGCFDDTKEYIITVKELQKLGLSWIDNLQNQLREITLNTRCSDVAYAATNNIVNLRKIEEEQIRLKKVEILSSIETLKKFLNIDNIQGGDGVNSSHQ
jgi:glutaredoxin-related protein